MNNSTASPVMANAYTTSTPSSGGSATTTQCNIAKPQPSTPNRQSTHGSGKRP